jgi:hypothetical protein
VQIDKLDSVEDTKGNNGDRGTVIHFIVKLAHKKFEILTFYRAALISSLLEWTFNLITKILI